MKFVIAILLLANLQLQVTSTKDRDIPETLSNEVNTLKTTKTPSPKLLDTIKTLTKLKNDEIFCQSCHMVINQVISHRRSGTNRNSMIEFFRKLCTTFTDWGSVPCAGYIDIEIDTVLYIIDNKENLTSEKVCAILFQQKGCIDPQPNKWSVTITPSVQTAQNPPNITTAFPWKVLHLTDFHYDPLYQPGNNADCGVPLCCQISSGAPLTPQTAAGYWGDYHVCDTPWHTVTDFTEYITKTYDNFDLIYYTGDIISHKSWATNKDDNSKAIKDLFQLFKDTFKDTPVYPILGNHEPHPTDFYAPGNLTDTKFSTQWMFDLVAEEWGKWLPSDTQSTIKLGGYYTVLVKPGFRIVALNSNVCYNGNLWLLYDDEDPYNQLKWLVQVLTEAEKNGEKVHILSHIPPGDMQCLQQWTNQFRKIINRFAGIISAQFNGHTHLDELRLFKNDVNKVINAAFNAGSFTTFVGFNPNYRIYSVDQRNYTVLDYDHYIFNLTEANQFPNKSPRWYKLYSFKEAYGLQDTTYKSLEDLVNRMANNSTLVQQYFKYQVRDSDPKMAEGCDGQCLDKLLCSITAVEAKYSVQCQQMKKKK